jgi:hydroxyethylthiazole kinase-like uncharacterized protein yjeF
MTIGPVTAEEMAEIDRVAQEEYGISQSTLMENAGRSVAEAILADTSRLSGSSITVVCGRGNNGGDGFVAARYLWRQRPKRITVYVSDPAKIKPGAAKDNFEKISGTGVEIRDAMDFMSLEKERGDLSVFVDSLFGTGFKGALPDIYGEISEWVRARGVRVYAVDVPSGLDATSGEAPGGSFKAFKTVTFGLPKKGFYAAEGPQSCGEIVVADIGFPRELLERYS